MPMSDAAARARALDPTASFIVQAPAGSGKTELLIQRYLKLLSVVDEPEEIVAVTFTKKAAAEMRERVVKALRRAATRHVIAASGQVSLFSGAVAIADEPLQPHERVTNDLARAVLDRDRAASWGLLENPARIGINTIDSLSATITRRMPWTSRFGAFPRIEEKAEALYREAARRTLRWIEGEGEASKAVCTILLHLDNDTGRAESLIARMLEKRDQWLPLIGSGREDLSAVRRQMEATLTGIVEQSLRDLHVRFPRHLLELAVDLAEIDFDATDIDCWRELGKFLITGEGTVRKQASRMGFPKKHRRHSDCQRLLDGIASNTALAEALCELRHVPAPRYTDDQWRAVESIIPLLPVAVAELRAVFGERDQIDFAELTLSANRALEFEGQPTDLSFALGYRIRHILIDEFQDTSHSQWKLFSRLTAGWDSIDGRTLFLVGDPMQSIYRFREADVALFLKAREEGLGGIRLEPLILSRNFRATPALVGWVNRAFPGIMPATDDNTRGAVAFTASEPAREAGAGDAEPVIHALIAESQSAEAECVIDLLRHRDPERSTAILVRARSHLTAIVAALKREGIDFQAIEIDQLAERPLVQDLMALTFALLHPADRASYFAVLRAPWCGLTLADMLVLDTPQMSADGVRRLARIQPILTRAAEDRGHRRLRELVESAWIALGGPSCVARDADLEDASTYFDLIERVDEGGDLSSFGALRKRVADLFAKPDTRAKNAVEVMTIHKAKGLERDLVILPGLGETSGSDEQPLLAFQELPSGELIMAPVTQSGRPEDPIGDWQAAIERAKTDNETARLLYVAATRAKYHLHLFGTLADPDKRPRKRTFLELLFSVEEVARKFRSAEAGRTVALPGPHQPRTIQRVPIDWRPPAPPAAVRWTRAEAQPSEAPPITFEWVGDMLRHTGTVLHALVQRIAREGLDRWPADQIRARAGHLRSLLSNAGIVPADLPAALARVTAALLNCIEDPRARWILMPHPEHACEYAITGWLDGRFVSGSIDRTFVAEGARWIVDYKTSLHEGGGLPEFLENEKLRYRDQLERYARLLALTENRPIRVGLYFPLLRGWVEWSPAAE